MQQPIHLLLVTTFLASITLYGCGSDNDDKLRPPLIEFPIQYDAPLLSDLAENGVIFTTDSGLSLYVFNNDEAGTSNCNAEADAPVGGSNDVSSCAAVWPPLLVADGATETSEFSFITRTDGTSQWAWNGFPLYLFHDDNAQAQINGDGINSVFHLARPTPVKALSDEERSVFVGHKIVLSASSTAEVLELFRADKEGFSLYTFDNDTLGSVSCISDGCTSTWPPLLADQGTRPDGKFSVIERGEQHQWAYDGKPLYFFKDDLVAGDTLGDGAGNVFHLASNEAAIFRTNDAGSLLTASGNTLALIEKPTESGTFEVEEKAWDQFTLYTFKNDENNVSNCVDGCAVNWPAFIAEEYEEDSGALAKFSREDGLLQWAYKGQPLYFFVTDTVKGQANGDGAAGGLFNIVKPPVFTSIVTESNDLGDVLTVNSTVLVLVSDGAGNTEVLRQNKAGFALYTFANDDVESTSCLSNGCMGNWPALLASENDLATAPFSIFERADGHLQWAINGQPLYFFTQDETAEDTNGEGLAGSFFVARP